MDGSPGFLDFITLQNLQMRLEFWLLNEVFTLASLLQIFLIALVFAASYLLAKPLAKRLAASLGEHQTWDPRLKRLLSELPDLIFPALALFGLLLAMAGVDSVGLSSAFVSSAASLTAAWIIIRAGASLLASREAARTLAIVVWILAALNILGLIGYSADLLDSIGFRLAERRITLLMITKAVILLVFLLWLVRLASRFLVGRIERSTILTPSIKVLAEKSLKIALIAAVFLLTLDFVGVDLTAFAVFTGAVGVGVGFGLQKVISNLISGFILLMDRSIKPGDVIELDQTFGWVTSLGARYVALSTRDGKEWLIPNEDLITQRVINWSYSNKLLRLPLKFGVSYHSDVRKAMELAVQAGGSVNRVIKDPAPVCRLTGFGDSSVEMELRVWISDPQGGVMNVRSEIYLALWDLFHEHGIEIPFPQRDLHLKEGSSVTVRLQDPPKDGTPE
jgi:small-conductance mechanosensitive channel